MPITALTVIIPVINFTANRIIKSAFKLLLNLITRIAIQLNQKYTPTDVYCNFHAI